jgi:outer membrane lipoprotein carrier protein
MIKVLVWTLSSLFLGIFAQTSMSPQEVVQFKQGMQKTMASLQSITSTFEQIRHLDYLEKPIQISGTFYYQKPHSVRWVYGQPEQQSFLLDGKYLHTIQKGKSKKTSLQGHRGLKELHNLLQQNRLEQDFFKEDAFQYQFFKDGKNVCIRLTPKDKQLAGMIQRIDVWVNPQNYIVQEIKIWDKEQNHTQILFRQQKINTPIPAAIFEVPSGK